jgi:hypothetical protein
MPAASNKIKQPSTTAMPRRNPSLPESINSPIAATATTANVVAVDPDAAPCTHMTPSAIGFSVGGSESERVGKYIGVLGRIFD